ncbi:hypothetical protein BN1708_017701, partial [Verticillium longisporum]
WSPSLHPSRILQKLPHAVPQRQNHRQRRLQEVQALPQGQNGQLALR